MEKLVEILGENLQGPGQEKEEGEDDEGPSPPPAPVPTSEALAEKTVVGLYFSSGSEACKEFDGALTTAYSTWAKAKGFELVFVPCDFATNAEAVTRYEEMLELLPELDFYMMPMAKTDAAEPSAEIQALRERYEVAGPEAELPKLVLIDPEGETINADAVEKVKEDPEGEEFPWKAEEGLSEHDIFVKLDVVAPEPGESGLKGIFINRKNYIPMGLSDEYDEDESGKIIFSGQKLKPYTTVGKQACLDEVKRMGFASDWHPLQKDVTAFQGETILLIFDPEKGYGEKIIMTLTQDAYEREWARIQELRETIIADFEAAKARKKRKGSKGGGGGGGGAEEEEEVEETIVVRDLPKECKEWVSETAVETHKEVENFTIGQSRPPMQVMITRPRSNFGKGCKFSDSGENTQNCRPQKDPNFALQRRELELGIQAVKEVKTCSCQTTWHRPVNKSTQYSPDDFLPKASEQSVDKVDELTDFLTAVSVSVEEALQTNETVDIFQEEFSNLGEEDGGDKSSSNSNMKEYRTFHDVQYTKGKRVEWVEWVPNSQDMLVCSYCENQTFTDRLENAGKASTSSILIWSAQDQLQPHANLVSPWEVTIFKFYPSDGKYLVGGLNSGQLAVWKLSDADLGYTTREKVQARHDEEKTSTVPSIPHKVLSMIDESHKKAVMGIEWLPAAIEIERRGRGASEKNPKDGPVKYFVTIGGDGQVMIWDFLAMQEAINDNDFVWKPVHRVQLQRQDSGTEMGCCGLLYCKDKVDDKGNKLLTNFFASTEEGELVFGDWAAAGGEDRKPEYIKQLFTLSKSFRPTLSLERSPFFPDILLAVTDWAFYLWKDDLWKDGIKEPLFMSSYTSNYFTRGCWSPTRPSVIFLGLASGGIDIWDFSDQSHKASLSEGVTSQAISSMNFLRHGDMSSDQKLATGDSQGHLHVHVIPKNLTRKAGRENDNMRKFIEREETRVRYFQERRGALGELKEKMEKEQQLAEAARAAEEDGGATKPAVDHDKEDAKAEEVYQAMKQACLEELGIIKPSVGIL